MAIVDSVLPNFKLIEMSALFRKKHSERSKIGENCGVGSE